MCPLRQTGQKGTAALLIDHGADVDSASNDGLTPLYFAAMRGHTSCAALLIERGADVNIKTTYGYPLFQAAQVRQCFGRSAGDGATTHENLTFQCTAQSPGDFVAASSQWCQRCSQKFAWSHREIQRFQLPLAADCRDH